MKILPLLVITSCLIISVVSCKNQPDADNVYAALTAGECQFISSVDGELFYPEDSRFKGQVVVTDQSVRVNLFDQYESNTIMTLTRNDLFAKKPIVQSIKADDQLAGSVMIGRVRDKAQRTGEGLLMTEGTVTVEHISDEKVVIRLAGKVGNFNTMRDQRTWKRLEGLLVYRKPMITMPAGGNKTLFY